MKLQDHMLRNELRHDLARLAPYERYSFTAAKLSILGRSAGKTETVLRTRLPSVDDRTCPLAYVVRIQSDIADLKPGESCAVSREQGVDFRWVLNMAEACE